MYRLPALLVALTCVCSACAQEKENARKPMVVPFELLKTGHMTVQVLLNGKGPYTLIFDTGAPITLVNNKVAKEAGLLEGKKKPALTFFGNNGDVKIKEMVVGTQKAEDVLAIVMDHPTVEAISKALGPIEGIIGFPFFARYNMTIDYKARTLTFVPNGYKPGDVMKSMVAALSAPPTRVLAPAAQWGLLVSKEETDEDEGVTVKEVLVGSAAATAGVKTGDRLLTLDGRWTDTVADLYSAAAGVKAGSAVPVKVRRAGKDVELSVKPASGL